MLTPLLILLFPSLKLIMNKQKADPYRKIYTKHWTMVQWFVFSDASGYHYKYFKKLKKEIFKYHSASFVHCVEALQNSNSFHKTFMKSQLHIWELLQKGTVRLQCLWIQAKLLHWSSCRSEYCWGNSTWQHHWSN